MTWTAKRCQCRAAHGAGTPTGPSGHEVGGCPNDAITGRDLCGPCEALACEARQNPDGLVTRHDDPAREAAHWRATAEELHGLILQALDYEREAFEEDTDVEGGDLCEFFSGWRARVEAALKTLAAFGPPDPEDEPHRALPRPRLSAPGSTVEDLERDHAMLDDLMTLLCWARHNTARFQDRRGLGLVNVESEKAESWLRERLAETSNALEIMEGRMEALPVARVLVTMEGGLIQNIDADVPGVEVIVADFDTDGIEEYRLVPNGAGEKATWVTWRPVADPGLLDVCEEHASQANQQEEEEEARCRAAEAEAAAQIEAANKAMTERKALTIALRLAEYGAEMVSNSAQYEDQSEEEYMQETVAEEADREHAQSIAGMYDGDVATAPALVFWLQERLAALDQEGR